MLTILITASTPANDFSKKYMDFINLVLKYENNFEVIFLAKNDYPDKDAFRILASQLPNHQFVVLNENNNDNELVLVGLAQAQGDDILLCTWDTQLVVVEQLLLKRHEGSELVFVKNKKNKFKKFFEAFGMMAYNFGARLLKHNYDMFAETEVQLLDGRVANLICSAPEESFELRVTNNYKQLKQSVVEEKEIYENRDKKNTSPMLSLGVVAFIYIVALLSLVIVTPFCYNGVYSWWSLVAIAALLIVGVVGAIVEAKSIYKNRNTSPVRINKDGEPILIVEEYVCYGQEEKINYDTDFVKEVSDLFEKNKENDAESNNEELEKQPISPALLIRKSDKLNNINKTDKNTKAKNTIAKSKQSTSKPKTQNTVKQTKTNKTTKKAPTKTKNSKQEASTKSAKEKPTKGTKSTKKDNA